MDEDTNNTQTEASTKDQVEDAPNISQDETKHLNELDESLIETPDISHEETKQANELEQTLILKFVPSSWGIPDLKDYIKKNTVGSNEKISESICELSQLKNDGNTAFSTWTVEFSSLQLAEDAKTLLRCVNDSSLERRIGVHFYLRNYETGKDLQVSPWERSRSPIAIKNEDKEADYYKVLYLANIPDFWNKFSVTTYIKKYTRNPIVSDIKFVFILKSDGTEKLKKCLVRFGSQKKCEQAFCILQKVGPFDGNQPIRVEYENPEKSPCLWNKMTNRPDFSAMRLRSKIAPNKYRLVNPKCQTNNDQETKNVEKKVEIYSQIYDPSYAKLKKTKYAVDPKSTETYGLSLQFLKSLNIAPPLTNKIYVTNLTRESYGDEEKIKKLFSHAGMVVSVAIVGGYDVMKIKVEFDHPVEAVQAVSMFHNQEVYDTKLIVKMDQTVHGFKRFLPEGLTNLGPGLGPNGLPLKSIRSHIEIENLKQTLMNEIAKLKENINKQGKQVCNDNQQTQDVNQQMNAFAALANSFMNPQTNPLLAFTSLLNPQSAQMLQLFSQQNAANFGGVMNQPQSFGAAANPQTVSTGWNIGQSTDVAQNAMQVGYNANIQDAQNMQGLNPQGGPDMQAGINMQGVPNMQSGYFMQGGPHMQVAPHMQSALHMQDTPNMQGGTITNGGNIHGAPNIQGSNMQGASNMHSVPTTQGSANMPIASNVQISPNLQRGSNIQIVPNMQAGPNTQHAPKMQSGSNVQGRPNLQPVARQKPPNQRKFDNDDSERFIKHEDSCTVMFNYLPPSVTLQALKTKMQEVGDIKLADITGPGRAIVVFCTPRDAESCIKLLNHTKVDGQTIDVRYL